MQFAEPPSSCVHPKLLKFKIAYRLSKYPAFIIEEQALNTSEIIGTVGLNIANYSCVN